MVIGADSALSVAGKMSQYPQNQDATVRTIVRYFFR